MSDSWQGLEREAGAVLLKLDDEKEWGWVIEAALRRAMAEGLRRGARLTAHMSPSHSDHCYHLCHNEPAVEMHDLARRIEEGRE